MGSVIVYHYYHRCHTYKNKCVITPTNTICTVFCSNNNTRQRCSNFTSGINSYLQVDISYTHILEVWSVSISRCHAPAASSLAHLHSNFLLHTLKGNASKAHAGIVTSANQCAQRTHGNIQQTITYHTTFCA